MGLRGLGHPLRRLPAARPPARHVREARRRRRGAPADRHRRARSRCTSRGTPSTTTTSCARAIESRGLRVGAVNPNLFQDPDYKLGSVTHPDAAVREKAVAHMLECVEIATGLGRHGAVAVAGRRHQLSGPGRPARAAPADARLPRARLRRAARRAGVPGRVQVLRAGVLRDRPGRLGQRAADLPQARRAREGAGRPRPSRAGHEHRADRRVPVRRGPPRRVSLQQPQVRRRRPDRRLGQPVRAVPDLRRAHRVRRAAAPHDRPVAQHRGQGRGDDAVGRQPAGGLRQGPAGRPRRTARRPAGRRRARRPRGPARRLQHRRPARVRRGARRAGRRREPDPRPPRVRLRRADGHRT